MKHALRSLLALVLAFALQPAVAQTSLQEIVQISVLDGGKTARDTHHAALRLTLADGWKTYWRAPGDAGIPPSLSWDGSRNVAATSVTWPTPVVFDQAGYRSVGYVDQLVLPVEITPRRAGQAITLKGRIEIGVCAEICVPAAFEFSQTLNPDAGRNPAIAAALAARPFSEAEAGVRSATCALRPTEDGLRITAEIAVPSTGGPEFAVFEPDNPKIWSSQARVSRKGGVLTATSDLVHVDGAPYALDRSAMRITIIGQRHAVDIRGCSAN